MGFFDRDGERLYMADSGPGGDGRPALLFCHGFLMDHSMFDPQVHELASGYRCLAFDARGFGLSTCRKPFTYWDAADDAVGVLDQAGVDRAVFVGMSQGGFLGLRAALAHPDRVAGLVLIDTAADIDAEETRAGYDGMHRAWTTLGPVDEVARPIADLLLGVDYPDTRLWLGKWRYRPADDLTHPFTALVGREDLSDRLGEVDCPVLIVHGTADLAITVDRAEAMAQRLPDVRGFVRVEGAAHAANLTHAEAVNPPLREFLAGLT